MVRFCKIQAQLALLVAFLMNSCFGTSTVTSMPSSPTFTIAALTWNIGNTTAKDNVVADLAEEIEKLGKPDVIVVGTQEELAKNREELKDKLLLEFGKQRYIIAEAIDENSAHTTTAGMHKTGKKIALAAGQTTPVSKTLNLPQNRNTLAVFVKKGYALENVRKWIIYPPGKTKANKSFILIEGDLKRGNVTLPISVASVHLDATSDKIRRLHTNYFLDNQKFTNTNKKYEEVLREAKRFHLIMGDFNERDYLMKDHTVVDRGYLTNFTAYGYDYSAKQERETLVYGTYGFTKLDDKTPVTLADPRGKKGQGRKHNAKGGYLDQIVITSGLPIDSPPAQYGGVTIKEEFKFTPSKKLFYSDSDHLPILRTFSIEISNDDEAIVKSYIKRRLPDFSKEIADLKFLLEGKKIDDMKSRTNKLMFYDDKESPDDFLKKIGSYDQILFKRTDLEKLQEIIKALKAKIDRSHDQQFLAKVFNQITICNQNRNRALEEMDDPQVKIQWYIPNVLSQENFEGYTKTLNDLTTDQPPGVGSLVKAETEKAPKKKGKLRSLLSRKKSAT